MFCPCNETDEINNGRFFHDYRGQRVMTVEPNGTTIYTPFPTYEKEVKGGTTIERSTYSLAGQAIATRVSGDPIAGNNGLFYIHSDHLGSSSAMSYGNGHAQEGQLVPNSLTRYTPFGDYRTGEQGEITDRGFTGHKENRGIGLTYMNARYYVPSTGRFLSADTIVPDPTNPQTFNRYSYVRNNPLKYIDPTGHRDCEFADSCPLPAPAPSFPKEDGDDISKWLVWQMNHNAEGEDADLIRGFNSLSMPPDFFEMHATSLFLFRDLVDYGEVWDFKVQFNKEDIRYITIDGHELRMDIVANIHYGFIGNQVGIYDFELLLFAGIAQQIGGDRASGALNSYGDEPADTEAAGFGILLSKRYGSDVTMGEFINLFNEYFSKGIFDKYLME